MSSAPSPAPRGFFERLTSALHRRARHAWSRLTGDNAPPPIGVALDWLLDQDTGHGLPARVGESEGCPGTTGACLATVLNCGGRDVAHRWVQWLLTVQRPDGAFADAADHRSFERTAWAVHGLLAVADDVPEAEAAIARACGYLCAWLDAEARREPPEEDENESPVCLPHVLPLLEAGRHWANADWVMSALGAADYFAAPETAQGFYPFASWTELVLQRDGIDAARQAMEPLLACQQPDGSVRNDFGGSPVFGFEAAHLAVLWYQLGWAEQANLALAHLEQRLKSDGNFELDGSWFTAARGPHESPLAAKFYLDAALLRVEAAFDATWQEFPDAIDPADGRRQAVGQWLAAFPEGARVADVGCGRGRFLRSLRAEFPQVQLTGIDISSAMLACLPDDVAAREGSLLHIPAADGEFDGALAVESLEHALLPERAVAELCRVVRPGGRVLIIDKNLAKQALSEYDPWERWFTPEELRGWLSRACDAVTVRSVSHLEGRPGNDLFLAAEGVRRG